MNFKLQYAYIMHCLMFHSHCQATGGDQVRAIQVQLVPFCLYDLLCTYQLSSGQCHLS